MNERESLETDAAPEGGVYLDIAEATSIVGKPLQVSIDNGHHGYRIAGPKYGCSGSRLLRRIKLTERDAREIARYLSEVSDV